MQKVQSIKKEGQASEKKYPSLAHEITDHIRFEILDKLELGAPGYLIDTAESLILDYLEERLDKVPVKFENLSRDEQISFFIQQVSGHDHETEIINILAILAAYNLESETYLKHFEGCCGNDIVNILNSFMNNTDVGVEEEDLAWNIVIDSIGIHNVQDVIDNPEKYITEYLNIIQPLEDLKEKRFGEFAAKYKVSKV